MAQSRAKLKALFKNGLKPDENDFANLIDSSLNSTDDNIYPVEGFVGIGTEKPRGYLHVNPNAKVLRRLERFRERPYIIVGDVEDYHLIISVTGISARNGNDKSELDLNNEGDVAMKGALIRSSDRSLKENIEPLDKGLKEVLELKPVSFTWKSNQGEEKDLKYGFIAQEMEAVVPDITYTSKRDNIKGISEIELIPLLVKSIQEQQTQISTLEKRIEKLEKLMQKK